MTRRKLTTILCTTLAVITMVLVVSKWPTIAKCWDDWRAHQPVYFLQPAEQQTWVDKHPSVKRGMTREQVVAKLGAASRTNWFDSDKPFFGPHFEDMPQGVKIEIWNYPDKHGTHEIWFLKNSNAVWHTSFCGNNVVF